MRALIIGSIVASALALFTGAAFAETDKAVLALPKEPTGKLVVGTVPIAPFIIKNADGTWSGISIDLWKEVARRLKLDYEIREMTVKDLGDDAKMNALDVFVSLNVSADREAISDLTHAFYSTGLAIAVSPKDSGGLGGTLKAIFTPKFAKLIGALTAMLLAIGVLMWLAERRRNDQFGGSAAHGIGAGLWWSAVTMTTVGYGDKAPVTFVGRILGLVWMFAAILIIASFTASISSALTVSSLSSSVSGPGDLPKVKVGTVESGNGPHYLGRRQIKYKNYKDVSAALDALAANEIEAVVYEAPILQYAIKQRADSDLTVLDGTFDNHGYALMLKQASPLREAINIEILQFIATDDWSSVLQKYLGAS
jgi:ABC-type amino acid transport substrate-binding protein